MSATTGAERRDTPSTGDPYEKEYGMSQIHERVLPRSPTSASMPISSAHFEELYLAPQFRVPGDFRHRFANPTPIAVAGLLIALTPLCCMLLGWQGTGSLSQMGQSNIAAYIFFGGALLWIGGFGEFLLGNTFPMLVFFVFGSFYFTFGFTLQPSWGAFQAYASDPVGDPYAGQHSPEFLSSFAWFLFWMIPVCLIFCIASIRTNIVFFLMFLLFIPTLGCLSASMWYEAQEELEKMMLLQHVGAGIMLGVCVLGWYDFAAMVLASTDFPLTLPLGDLSMRVPGLTDLKKHKQPDLEKQV